jgi:hypothetical protein
MILPTMNKDSFRFFAFGLGFDSRKNIDAFILLYIWTDRWNIWRVTDFAGEEKFR